MRQWAQWQIKNLGNGVTAEFIMVCCVALVRRPTGPKAENFFCSAINNTMKTKFFLLNRQALELPI